MSRAPWDAQSEVLELKSSSRAASNGTPVAFNTLSTFFRQYVRTRGLRGASLWQYRHAMNDFDRFCEEGQFDDGTLNRWTRALIDRGFKLHTVRSRRRRVLSVWRAAAKAGLCEPPHVTCRVVRVRKPIEAMPGPKAPSPEMRVATYLRRYERERDISESAIKGYETALANLERFARRSIVLRELRDDLLNAWLEFELQTGKSRWTIRGQRGAIISIWRAAWRDGILHKPPQRVRPVKRPALTSEAYTAPQLESLLAAAPLLRGKFTKGPATGIPRSVFATAWLLVAYYTGLRPIDMASIPLRDLLSGNPFPVRQHKTNHVIVCSLPAEAIAAARRLTEWLDPKDAVAFPVHRSTLFDVWRELAHAAGVKGSPKWIRRTGATASEIQTPGSAQAYLGHKTPGLAYKHYVDLRQVTNNRELPPRIGIAKGGEA